MSYSRKPGAKSARFEPSCITSHILMALQTINRSVLCFPCLLSYQGLPNIHTYNVFKGLFVDTHKTHELAQLLLMFSNYMYFRELNVDLAGVWRFQVMLRLKDVIRSLRVWIMCLILDKTHLSKSGFI
ncbi:hypothetical protein HanRHA438_Chr09g0390501 [Helianthus annuus]|nr:hypothetical protein HanRHA438_Chr09g0390501 [Helianthus annuus]